MTTITLNSLEPHIAQRLQQRANDNGRTLEAEITNILSIALSPEEAEESITGETGADLVAEIKQRFAPYGNVNIPEIPREPVRTPPDFS